MTPIPTKVRPSFKPIIFSPPMVLQILNGQKTQTRRVIKENLLIAPGFPNEFVSLCRYGQRGAHLEYSHSNDDCIKGHYERDTNNPRSSTDANSSVSEQQLYGRRGRADIFMHEIPGFREEGTYGMASPSGMQNEQGVSQCISVSRGQTCNEGNTSSSLHGISWDAESSNSASSTLGRKSVKQSTNQLNLGDTVRELGGSETTRTIGDGGTASSIKIEGHRARTSALGNIKGVVQSKSRGGYVEAFPCNSGGDCLWIRETWAIPAEYDHLPPSKIPLIERDQIWYIADGVKPQWAGRSRSSIFMPRSLSRLALEITEVKIERLLEISENDSISEGFSGVKDFLDYFYKINPKLLDPNPYVWAIAFRPVQSSKTITDGQN